MTTTVAVIGLGAMGLPMATRLAERFDVRGFDIAADRLALAAESGVAAATSAVDAVSGAQAVLVAVRTGAQLHDLLFGDDGLAEHLAQGSVVILTSTVGADGIDAIDALDALDSLDARAALDSAAPSDGRGVGTPPEGVATILSALPVPARPRAWIRVGSATGLPRTPSGKPDRGAAALVALATFAPTAHEGRAT